MVEALPTRALVEALGRYVARRVPAEAVDDVLQDTLERVARAELRDAEALQGFAFRVARSAAADFHRRRRPERPVAELPERGVEEVAEAAVAEAEVDVRPLAAWLRMAGEELDEALRSTMRRVELEGATHAEAAAEEGVARSTISARVARGRAELRRALVRCCEVELDARGAVMSYRPRSCEGC